MDFDVAIIGAGMAGASIAAFLPGGVSAVLLEAEDQPGYHTTGRSAAFFTETYGGPDVQPFTTASKGWYYSTRSPVTQQLMVHRRGALHVAWEEDAARLNAFANDLSKLSPDIRVLSAIDTMDASPLLQREGLVGGVWDPDCCDIDVAQVHALFLRQAASKGHKVFSRFQVAEAEYRAGLWTLTASSGTVFTARTVVNAAGAWADDVAVLFGAQPLGLSPLRRTIGLFDTGGASVSEDTPLVLDLDETFYFKPQSGALLVSPADETPSLPCDAQPEMEDIAMAAHRVETATTLSLARCTAKWAGLRTFAPDRSPVYGFDDAVPGFFWCAGQGGFGIQTAPAAGEFAAALLLGEPIKDDFTRLGITAQRYAPRRFAKAA